MAIDPTLPERLKQFGDHLATLRGKADELRRDADGAVISGTVDTATLVNAESSADALYVEISAFKTVLAEVEKASPLAAGQLGPVSDALHLLLLEITEIGTRLYSVRSDLMGPLVEVVGTSRADTATNASSQVSPAAKQRRAKSITEKTGRRRRGSSTSA
jgi:hypothetical protein